MQRLRILLFLMGLVPLSNCVFANQNGDGNGKESVLTGSVSDASSRKPVKGVTISIASKDKIKKFVTTDASGQFSIPKLPAGEVTIILEKKGYKTYRKEKFVIREGMQVQLKVDMSNEKPAEDINLLHPLLRMMES